MLPKVGGEQVIIEEMEETDVKIIYDWVINEEDDPAQITYLLYPYKGNLL